MVRKMGRTALAVVFVAIFIIGGTGCSKYASPDDMKKLKEAEQAAISAEKELSKTIAERQKLEQELAAKQQELKEAEAELEHVKSR